MAESLQRSTLGSLKVGSSVNLERAMAADGRFGGYRLRAHRRHRDYHEEGQEDNAMWYHITVPKAVLRYIVAKGQYRHRRYQPHTVATVGSDGGGVHHPPYPG